MKCLSVFFLLIFTSSSYAGEIDQVDSVFSCMSFLTKNAKNEKRNKKLEPKTIRYLCRSSNGSGEALRDVSACTYNVYARNWKNPRGQTLSATAYGAVYACAYADGSRNDCVIEGQEAGVMMNEISTLCNPYKKYVMDEVARVLK